jgi:hypothetical protein
MPTDALAKRLAKSPGDAPIRRTSAESTGRLVVSRVAIYAGCDLGPIDASRATDPDGLSPMTTAPRAPQRSVPPERQALYHVGQLVLALGILVFLGNMGRMACAGSAPAAGFDPLRVQSPDFGGLFAVGVLGMALLVVGALTMSIAGAGVVLDPERARKDLEPYSRQAGGMLRDALDEAAVEPRRVIEVVRVRCGRCAALNDEAARYCSSCGMAFPARPA